MACQPRLNVQKKHDPWIIVEKIPVEEHTIIYNCQSGNYEIATVTETDYVFVADDNPSISGINISLDEDGTILDDDFVLVGV